MRARAVLANLSLLGFGCLAALALAEIVLRLHDPVGQRLRGDRIDLPRNVSVEFRSTLNPRLGSEIRFRRNRIGFRGPDPPPDFDRRLTIVAVGGSTTECLYLNEGRSWPEQLAALLRPRFDSLWVNNAGLDGHTTFGHLMLLEQLVLPLRPKLVLFLIGLNDVGRELPKGRELVAPEPDLPTRLARVSALAALLQNLGRQRAAQRENLPHRELDFLHLRTLYPKHARARALLLENEQRYLPGFRERVERIVSLCRAHGVEPVLMTQPALYSSATDPDTGTQLALVEVDDERQLHGGLAWRLLEQYNDVTRAVGRERKVLVVDVARRVEGRSAYFYDWMHFTEDGAGAVARAAAEALEPFLSERFRGSAAQRKASRRLPERSAAPRRDRSHSISSAERVRASSTSAWLGSRGP